MVAIKKVLRYCVLIAFLVNTTGLKAQESMLPDVSNELLGKLIDTAKKYYPRLVTFDHRIIIAKENIKKAQLAWFDMFSFSYLYSPNNSTTLVNPSVLNGYQLGIYLNISSLITKPHNTKQAKEELVITKLQQDEYALNLVAEVKNRYYRYIQQKTLLRMRTLAAIDAENLMKQMKYKFEKSEETFESYNRVMVAYNDRRQNVVISEADVLIAKAFLEEMIAMKLEDIR